MTTDSISGRALTSCGGPLSIDRVGDRLREGEPDALVGERRLGALGQSVGVEDALAGVEQDAADQREQRAERSPGPATSGAAADRPSRLRFGAHRFLIEPSGRARRPTTVARMSEADPEPAPTSAWSGAGHRRPRRRRASCSARHPGAAIVVLEREPADRRPPERPLQRRHPRRDLLRAGLAEGAALRRGRARASTSTARSAGIPAERSGKVIVATDEAELPRLDELERRGRANGVPGLERIGPGELREIEPHAAGIAALHSPATGVVDFARGRRARWPATCARPAGGSSPAARSAALRAGRRPDRRRSLGRHARRRRGGRSAPGPGRTGSRSPPAPTPIRGSSPSAAPTCASAPSAPELVRSSIYPVPDPDLPFLGMHLTRDLGGEVLLGPDRAARRRARRLPAARGSSRATSPRASPGPERGG